MRSQKQTILCMYSGGLDSLGVLFRLLSLPEYRDYEIHVHHMHLLNLENRGEAEAYAVEQSLAALQRYFKREIYYTENVMEYRFLRHKFIWDMDLAAFMAANIIREYPHIVKVAMGRTKTDIENASERFFQRMERAQTLFETTLSLEKDITIPERIFPVSDMTKADIFRMLPEEIRNLAWSCRSPIYSDHKPPTPCGVCHTCRDLKQMREELSMAD